MELKFILESDHGTPVHDRNISILTNNVIGISSIMTNLQKVRKMVRLIGKHQPNAKVVVGGHIANIAELRKWTGAD